MLDKKRFAKSIMALGEMFDKQISDAVVDIYYQTLKDLTDKEFDTAINIIAGSQTYNKMPLAAQLRDAVKPKTVINPDQEAVYAFSIFKQGKDKNGAYNSVRFRDKTIHAVVRAMGGWHNVCLITEDDWQFRRREWLDLYKTFVGRGIDVPDHLPGLIEIHNSQNPDWLKHVPPIIEIGFEEDRKQIEA